MNQVIYLFIYVFLWTGKGVKQLSGEESNLKNGTNSVEKPVEIRRMQEV